MFLHLQSSGLSRSTGVPDPQASLCVFGVLSSNFNIASLAKLPTFLKAGVKEHLGYLSKKSLVTPPRCPHGDFSEQSLPGTVWARLCSFDGKGLGPAERQWWVHHEVAWPEDC